MFFNFSLTAARKGYSAFGAKSRTYTTPPSNFSNPMMPNVESNIAKQFQTMPKIKSGDIPNFIPTEIGDQNESPGAPKDPNRTENNELVCKPGPENEPIHMDSVSETVASEPEVGSVVLTSTPSQKTEAISTSNPASMVSGALSSSSTNIALIQKIAPKSLSKAAAPAMTSISKSCQRKDDFGTSGKKTLISIMIVSQQNYKS